MKSINQTLQEIVDRHSINYLRPRRDFILDLLDDGTFTRSELTEIDIALSLLSNAELWEMEKKFHSGVNSIELAVELVAKIRLKYWNIF